MMQDDDRQRALRNLARDYAEASDDDDNDEQFERDVTAICGNRGDLRAYFLRQVRAEVDGLARSRTRGAT